MEGNLIRTFIGCMWIAAIVIAAALSSSAQSGDSLVQCWSYREAVSVNGGLLVDNMNVYTVDAQERVVALDRKNGSVTWTSELGGSVVLPIRSINSTIIVVTRTNSPNASGTAFIRAISKATGITNWVSQLPSAQSYKLAGDERTIFVLAQDGPLVAVEPSNGAVRWSRDGSAFAGKESYLGANWIVRNKGPKTIEVVSLETWRTLGILQLSLLPKVVVSGRDGVLVAGDSRGNLESISLDRLSKNWKYKAGGAISHLILRDGNVIAASADNFVYSLSLSSGNVEWKRRMPGRVSSIGTLADSRLALTVVGEKTAYILDLSDGKFGDRVALGGDEEFVGYPLAGDDRFIVALTNQGVTAFSAGCAARKAADTAAA